MLSLWLTKDSLIFANTILMKIKYNAYLLLLTVVLGYLTACGGSTKPQTVTAAAADVFVAGFVVDANNVSTAMYWQNGVPNRLPDLGHGSEAHSISCSWK